MPEAAQIPVLQLAAIDGSGDTVPMRLWVEPGAAAAAALGSGRQLAPLVNAASGCSVFRVTVTYSVKELTPATPAPGGRADYTGLFVFETSEPEQYAIIALPGISTQFIQTQVANQPPEIDLQAPQIDALVQALINGIYCNRFGYQLTRCVAAFLNLRT